jgi:peptidoglycan hydrolase-like protein with peptidoglycan-binding domain
MAEQQGLRRPRWAPLLAAGVAAASLMAAQAAQADYYDGLTAYQDQDYETAFRELDPLARQGDSRAQFLIGRMYRDGRDVSQDYVQAHMWLNLAASAGQTEAGKERDALAERMTGEQIARAQSLAAAWRPESADAAELDSDTAAAEEMPVVKASEQYSDPYGADEAAAIEPSARSTDEYGRPLSRSQVIDLQWQLAVHGYDPGPADGVVGPRTRAAIRDYQSDADLAVDGEPSLVLLDHLQFTNPPVRNANVVAGYDETAPSAPVGQPRTLYSSKPSYSDYPTNSGSYGASSGAYDYAPAAAARLDKIYTVTIQRELAAKGYEPGPIDGVAGARTASAIRRYQADNGLVVDGQVSLRLLNHLRLITGAQAS